MPEMTYTIHSSQEYNMSINGDTSSKPMSKKKKNLNLKKKKNLDPKKKKYQRNPLLLKEGEDLLELSNQQKKQSKNLKMQKKKRQKKSL